MMDAPCFACRFPTGAHVVVMLELRLALALGRGAGLSRTCTVHGERWGLGATRGGGGRGTSCGHARGHWPKRVLRLLRGRVLPLLTDRRDRNGQDLRRRRSGWLALLTQADRRRMLHARIRVRASEGMSQRTSPKPTEFGVPFAEGRSRISRSAVRQGSLRTGPPRLCTSKRGLSTSM